MKMKKTITLQTTERGQRYFFIYNVMARDKDGDKIIVESFLDEKKAEEYKEFCYEVYSELYSALRVCENFVWV